MTDTFEALLGEFNRLGWAVSGIGQHRDYKGNAQPAEWFWSVYPATFGSEVWSDEGSRGSYSVCSPRITVTGLTAVEAGQKALKLLLDSTHYRLHAELRRAFEDNVDARENTDRVGHRTGGGGAGEVAGLVGV